MIWPLISPVISGDNSSALPAYATSLLPAEASSVWLGAVCLAVGCWLWLQFWLFTVG